MPIYEYQCRKCQAHIEILQKITDKPLTKCRKCGGRLDKQWSQASFQLKGTGWYVTDYAGKKSEGASEDAKKTAAETTTTAATGDQDSKKEKPAAKKTGTAAKPAPSSGTASGGD